MGEKDKDLTFAQDSSFSGQFAQQWELRMMAQEAVPKEIANSRLRRLLPYNKSFTRTGELISDTAPFYKAHSKRSTLR